MRIIKLLLALPCLIGFALPTLGQNVGIGTSNPRQKLHVASNSPVAGIRIENNAQEGDAVLQFALDDEAVITMGIDDSDGDKFKVGASALTTGTVMTIQRNGYLGLGTTEPEYNLHIKRDRPSTYVAFVENTNPTGSGLGAISKNTYNALGGITENEAGIGVYGGHTNGNGLGWGVYGKSFSSNGIGVHGTIETGGQGSWMGFGGYFSGTLGYSGGLYAVSDARLKTNVQPLSGALAKIGQLRGVTYQYNTDTYGDFVGTNDRTYIGFVAQEVEAVFPEAVADKYIVGSSSKTKNASASASDSPREVVKMVDYVSLVPVLVEAIKEQQAYIQQLESRISELEKNK